MRAVLFSESPRMGFGRRGSTGEQQAHLGLAPAKLGKQQRSSASLLPAEDSTPGPGGVRCRGAIPGRRAGTSRTGSGQDGRPPHRLAVVSVAGALDAARGHSADFSYISRSRSDVLCDVAADLAQGPVRPAPITQVERCGAGRGLAPACQHQGGSHGEPSGH